MEYRRIWHPGGTYFFTVNLLERRSDLLTRHIDALRNAIQTVRRRYPFKIHAWVVLPDHMHCVIELPEGDSNFAVRWRLIKQISLKLFRVLSDDRRCGLHGMSVAFGSVVTGSI